MFGFRFRRKYKKYIDMNKTGKTPREIYLAAKADGLEFLLCIEMLGVVCGLSPTEANKVILCYEKYLEMKESGKTPREVYFAAKTDGVDVDSIQYLGMLCKIFGLSPTEAKEVMICTDTGAKSLSEYQGKHILPALKEAFEQEERDTKRNENMPPKK